MKWGTEIFHHDVDSKTAAPNSIGPTLFNHSSPPANQPIQQFIHYQCMLRTIKPITIYNSHLITNIKDTHILTCHISYFARIYAHINTQTCILCSLSPLSLFSLYLSALDLSLIRSYLLSNWLPRSGYMYICHSLFANQNFVWFNLILLFWLYISEGVFYIPLSHLYRLGFRFFCVLVLFCSN